MLSLSTVVVVPFIFKQITCVMRQIELWSATPGCLDTPYPHAPDLLFYFNRDLAKTHEAVYFLQEILATHPVARRCFGTIRFISANLTDEEDLYKSGVVGQAHGPNNMFYRIFRNKEVNKDYDYMLWLEPDNIVIRPGWLSRFVEHVSASASDFWLKGPMSKHPGIAHAPFQGDPAIYRLGDPRFNSFLAGVEESYPGKSYDTAIYDFRTLNGNQWLFYETASQFIYYDYGNDEETHHRASWQVRDEAYVINLTGGKQRHCNSTGIARLISDWMRVYERRGPTTDWVFTWNNVQAKITTVV